MLPLDRKASGGPAAPIAAKRPSTSVHHGIELVDDYAWLRADNWQEVMRDPSVLDPEIRAYLEAENAHTEAALAGTRGLQDTLFAEMKARIKEDDNTVPAPDGPFEYYTSYITGGQYPRICRRPRGGGAEQIMLDGNLEADGKAYWQLGDAAHSPDHRYLAYSVDDKGSELFTIRVRDLATGQDLPDAIHDTRGSAVWGNDSKTIFYVRLDDNQRPLFVHRHDLGTAGDADPLIYEEKDPGFYVGVGQTQSGRFITIEAHDHQTTEIYLIDADAPLLAPRLVEPRVFGHEYSIEHHGERLFIMTNSGGAEDFRIVEAPVADPRMANWREVIPHKPGRLILENVAFKAHLVRLEREDGLPRITIRKLADGSEHEIAFDEEAYSLGMAAGYEFDTTSLRFTYSSMTTPVRVFDYDMEARTRVLRKSQEVPSGHNPDDYVTRRLQAPAADGELVPVSLLYRKGTPLDGSAPLFLYGYGSYGISMPSSFSTSRLSLVDRGFVFAIAHIRGGKEKGYRWYTGGKKETKLNTFTDFIAAGEYLAKEGFTKRGRIVANGGSAGGMLMGVVANMAPDLFLGIIADVPFVDVLNTMLDETLPLTPPEWPEWGDPIRSKAEFDIIRSYSPYDNVEAKAYPHIFAFAGLTDPRVTYWEPAKWIAKLREKATGDNLILLKTNMDAGHGGASGRFEALKELAVDYAFALAIAGKADAKVAAPTPAESTPALKSA
ncbi:MAG: S9 family peptidase [Hyphomicrobiales bacterium]|nr:MAG: S9 family peptidase [Hyphomicrobiales bacterium]